MPIRGAPKDPRPKRIRLICSCGLTSAKVLYPGGTIRAECPVCGEFGFYPRLCNARFSSEIQAKGECRKLARKRGLRPQRLSDML